MAAATLVAAFGAAFVAAFVATTTRAAVIVALTMSRKHQVQDRNGTAEDRFLPSSRGPILRAHSDVARTSVLCTFSSAQTSDGSSTTKHIFIKFAGVSGRLTFAFPGHRDAWNIRHRKELHGWHWSMESTYREKKRIRHCLDSGDSGRGIGIGIRKSVATFFRAQQVEGRLSIPR